MGHGDWEFYDKYAMTVDEFFADAERYPRCIVCSEHWQYDIVTKVFTRKGMRKADGGKYRHNADMRDFGRVDECGIDDWLPWRYCVNKYQNCCLDNRGRWGTQRVYENPTPGQVEYERAKFGINGLYVPGTGYCYTPNYPSGAYNSATVKQAMIANGSWTDFDIYLFQYIDFSKYLTKEEVERIKRYRDFPMYNSLYTEDDFNSYRRVKPSECIGTEEEEQEKSELLRKIEHPLIKERYRLRKDIFTISDFFDLGKYGDVQIQCDAPWQTQILKTVFERMGQETFYFNHVNNWPCYLGPGDGNYKRTIHFDDVDMSEYLTLDEVKYLVYMETEEPFERLRKLRNPERIVSLREFQQDKRMAIDCAGYRSEIVEILYDYIYDRFLPYSEQKRGRSEDMSDNPCAYACGIFECVNNNCFFGSRETYKKEGYRLVPLKDLDFPDKLYFSASRKGGVYPQDLRRYVDGLEKSLTSWSYSYYRKEEDSAENN